ncbi:MAG TPA: RNA polymerase sigma factor [Pirellulales bacterium]|nr:RNA polymerase sigma factor [Pirellulales bacterium]
MNPVAELACAVGSRATNGRAVAARTPDRGKKRSTHRVRDHQGVSEGIPHSPLASLDSAGEAADERKETAELDWCDIRATLGGDGQAYARIVRRYQDQIASQMWRLSRRRADCEQLVHDVFVEAFLSLKHFQGRAPLLHWLRKIATRVGYRYWKQQARLRRQATVTLQDWHKSSPAEQRADEAEAASQVHALLAQLPPRDRLVLTLIYLEGCSVAEAAERAGWSQTMTKVQAHRARKKLKKLLEEVRHE